jgi:hypothetical protein
MIFNLFVNFTPFLTRLSGFALPLQIFDPRIHFIYRIRVPMPTTLGAVAGTLSPAARSVRRGRKAPPRSRRTIMSALRERTRAGRRHHYARRGTSCRGSTGCECCPDRRSSSRQSPRRCRTGRDRRTAAPSAPRRTPGIPPPPADSGELCTQWTPDEFNSGSLWQGPGLFKKILGPKANQSLR